MSSAEARLSLFVLASEAIFHFGIQGLTGTALARTLPVTLEDVLQVARCALSPVFHYLALAYKLRFSENIGGFYKLCV